MQASAAGLALYSRHNSIFNLRDYRCSSAGKQISSCGCTRCVVETEAAADIAVFMAALAGGAGDGAARDVADGDGAGRAAQSAFDFGCNRKAYL